MLNKESARSIPLRGQGINPGQFITDRLTFTQFQTWLADTKGVVGCPVDCKYCFFQLDGKTPIQPKQITSPVDLVNSLKQSRTYTETMPINFGSETDIFSTKKNIDYYSQVLSLYGKSDYKNPVVLISKRVIPDEVMEIAGQMPQTVLFYMSLSGLAGTPVEPNVSSDVIKENFVRLKKRGLNGVHYYRPFLPINSSPDAIRDILDHVSQYAIGSVVNGLRLNDGIRENIAPFWPQLKDKNYDFTQSGEFWPLGVRDYLINLVKTDYPTYPVFFGNTPCSVAYAQGKPDIHGLYRGRMCQESQCPPDQRIKCSVAFEVPSLKTVEPFVRKIGMSLEDINISSDYIALKKAVKAGDITYLRNSLRFPVLPSTITYADGYNWATVREEGGIIEVPWTNNGFN